MVPLRRGTKLASALVALICSSLPYVQGFSPTAMRCLWQRGGCRHVVRPAVARSKVCLSVLAEVAADEEGLGRSSVDHCHKAVLPVDEDAIDVKGDCI